ncbi:MAG: NAD(+)/NADH kinase [Chloroflexi bacterium]|nr:NAD(+)/NADH kinase [Chloroflexota bacterium]
MVKKVGILYHPLKKDAQALAEKLGSFLAAEGLNIWLCSAWEEEKAKSQVNGTDLLLTVGGDGTILRAAQAAIPGSTPVTGVNLGRLGFMTELGIDEVMEQLPALLAGKGWYDERHLLEAELSPAGVEAEAGRPFYALNDVVVARGAAVRLIHVEVEINGARLATCRADGVIVATATGSTGYSLAAGGPILHPRSDDFLLVPIVPHLSQGYPIVLSHTSVVNLHLTSAHSAMLSVDGHINLPLSTGANIIVRHSSKTIRFLRIHREASFYASLEERLKGKQ